MEIILRRKELWKYVEEINSFETALQTRAYGKRARRAASAVFAIIDDDQES